MMLSFNPLAFLINSVPNFPKCDSIKVGGTIKISRIYSIPIDFNKIYVWSPTPGILFTFRGARNSFSFPGRTIKNPLGLASSVAILAIILLEAKPKEIFNPVV